MAPGQREDRPAALEFAPVLLANLLPLGGVVWFDWRLGEVVMLYWLEVVSMLLVYGAAALFAQREIVLEGRTFFLPGVSEDAELCESTWGDDPRTIRLGGSVPPIYPRNLRVIRPSLPWGLAFATMPIFVFEYQYALLSAVSPAMVGVALLIVGTHLAELRHEFFGERRYEELSAHMVLEIPCRIALFAFGFALVLFWVGGMLFVIVRGFASELLGTAPSFELLFGTGLIFGKLVVEWAQFRASRETDPGGIAGWFTPQDPLEE